MPNRSLTGSTAVTTRPSTVSVPDVGSIIRLIIRIEVVLPQPDGPTNTVSVPCGTSRLRLSTATVPSGYCLVTFSKVIIAALCSSRKRSSRHRLVESVVPDPLFGRLVGVDAGIALHRGVQLDQGVGGEFGRHRVEHGLELIGHLL